MTWSLFAICNYKTDKNQCFYGNGSFNENFDTILDLLKNQKVKTDINLFDFLKKYKLEEVSEIMDVARCLSVMDRIILCKIVPTGEVEFTVYYEIIKD